MHEILLSEKTVKTLEEQKNPDVDNLVVSIMLDKFNKKYDYSIVLDGKKKSIISSLLLRCKNKILITNKLFFRKILNLFFKKIFLTNLKMSKIDEIINILNYLNINYEKFNF